MTLLALVLPLAGMVSLLALNRRVATRSAALGGAGTLLLSALLLSVDRLSRGLPQTVIAYAWMWLPDQDALVLTLTLDAVSWPLALLVYAGGVAAIVSAALALPPDLRGFGGMFAALLAGLAVLAAGVMCDTPLLLPFIPVAVGVTWFTALRASGALAGSMAPLTLALGGSAAALALLVAALVERAGGTGQASAIIVGCAVMAALLLCGFAPAHTTIAAAGMAPAALAVFVPLGLPLAGAVALLRLLPGQLASLSDESRGMLLAIGLLAVLSAAARALWSRALRQIVVAQFSAQLGLVVVCAGCGEGAFAAVAPGLVANAVLTTLALMIGVVALERRTDSNDLMMLRPDASLWLASLGVLIAAASSVGVPGTWGMWPRLWLLDAAMATAPWVVAPLLAGSGMLALALVAPLAVFWRVAALAPAPAPASVTGIVAATVAAPLLVMGAMPGATWDLWFAATQAQLTPAVTTTPRLPALTGQIATAGASGALIVLSVLARRARLRRAPPVDERLDGVLTPDSAGAALYGIAWLAAPAASVPSQSVVAQIEPRARQGLLVLGKRYYLAVVVVVLIVIILVFAAG